MRARSQVEMSLPCPEITRKRERLHIIGVSSILVTRPGREKDFYPAAYNWFRAMVGMLLAVSTKYCSYVSVIETGKKFEHVCRCAAKGSGSLFRPEALQVSFFMGRTA